MLTELKAAVVDQGVKTAMIIDDLYDAAPTLAHVEREAWNTFFDDIKELERQLIRNGFGKDVDETWEQLKADEAFVRFVWERRAESGVFQNLFESFKSLTTNGRAILDRLKAFLENDLGLAVGTGGTNRRDTTDPPTEDTADIVFMDLFLGPAQDTKARNAAVARVVELLGKRAKPPLLVLMSSSIRLDKAFDEFRDDSGLLGCQFRMLHKPDIDNAERLLDVIHRLVVRYKDSQRLAAFVESWQNALQGATRRLLRRMRRLDLRDYADLQALILNAENERMGAYLVELYARVFQSELEADAQLFGAGKELDLIAWDEYPPAHFLPAKAAMELLDGMTFYNAASMTPEDHITLGDVLFVKLDVASGKTHVPAVDVDAGEHLVLMVMTQACDLQRGNVGRLLMLPGVARPMDLRLHKRPGDATITPMMEVDTRTFVVKWFPDVAPFTCTEEELRKRLEANEFRRVRRLRTIYALQLQQLFAANLTRIGTMTVPHVRHVVSLRWFTRGQDAMLSTLFEVGIDPESAVVMVGRQKEQFFDLLALAPDLVERLRNEMRRVDATKFGQADQKRWKAVLTGRNVFRALEQGVRYERKASFRPFDGQEDILDIVGPHGTPPQLDKKTKLQGPLVVQIITDSSDDDEREVSGRGTGSLDGGGSERSKTLTSATAPVSDVKQVE
jgi:hypothetical protein